MTEQEPTQDPTLLPGDEATPGTTNTGETLCPDCSGSGQVDGQACATCKGTGRVTEGIGGG